MENPLAIMMEFWILYLIDDTEWSRNPYDSWLSSLVVKIPACDYSMKNYNTYQARQ
jgi:hypothetical protein